MQKYEKQQLLPTFRPMSIVAKRSPVSATAELLLIIHTWGAREPPARVQGADAPVGVRGQSPLKPTRFLRLIQ